MDMKEGDIIQGHRLQKFGGQWTNEVYTDQRVAERAARGKKTPHVVRPVEVLMLNETDGVIENDLVWVIGRTWVEDLITRAHMALNAEQKRLLGIEKPHWKPTARRFTFTDPGKE